MNDPLLSRRKVLLAGIGLAVVGVAAACSDDDNKTQASAGTSATTSGPTTSDAAATAATTTLAATPECKDADDVTPAQTEGPYFKASSPERTDIRAGATGAAMALSGTVVTTGCKPVARALVDFWQCDGDGEYDNSGYTLRGHQFTDASGRFTLQTVKPGIYPGRTRHIHVKVQAPAGKVLTTQLYFPGEPQNASDGIYRKDCEITTTDNAKTATFQFVLA